jgi:hypothetical protein
METTTRNVATQCVGGGTTARRGGLAARVRPAASNADAKRKAAPGASDEDVCVSRRRRAVRVIGAKNREDDEPGEVGRAMFEDGVGVASFRGFKLVDEVTIELEVAGDAGVKETRGPGAGKVGMVGFDSAPGFASFSWMSEEAYEAYEDDHEHEHEHEHESVQVTRGPAWLAAVDNETKMLYAGVAAAATAIGVKSAKMPPPPPKVTSSTVSAKKQASPKLKNETAPTPSGKRERLDGATLTKAAVAAATTVTLAGIAASSGSFDSKSRVIKITKVESNANSVQRLERLRSSMISEFEQEIEKLNAVQKLKKEDLKRLEDSFYKYVDETKAAMKSDGDSAETLKALAQLRREHETQMKQQRALFENQEASLRASVKKLESALEIAEAALKEAQESNATMTDKFETELKAARGLIRAERALGKSEASKYRAARDLARLHVSSLRADLALTTVTSRERLEFLETQFKEVCASYVAQIVRERQKGTSPASEAELVSAVAEFKIESEAEMEALKAKYDNALRSASGERRALKALMDSEMKKADGSRSISSQLVANEAQLAAAEVAASKKMNDAIREAQISFEGRVADLKKAHRAEIERLSANAATADVDAKLKALEASHRVALGATNEAHAKALKQARDEADARIAQAEERVRQAVAKLDESEASKAKILAEFDAERINRASQFSDEQTSSQQEIDQMRRESDESLIRAISEIQSESAAEKAKLEALINELKSSKAADASNFDAQMREMKQSFEVRIKELEELQSSAAKNAGADLSDDVAKLQKQLTDRDAVEKELRRQVDETRKELNKLSRGKNDVKYTLPESVTYKFEGSSKESKELAKQRDALQLKVTDLEARLKSMERSNSEYDAKIAELKAVASAPAATPAANVNVDLKIKEIEAAKDAQLRQLQKSYEQKLADAQAQSSSGVDSAAVDDLKKQLAEQAWRLQEQKASAEEQLIEAVAELQAMRDAEQKAARSSAGERRALYALLKNEAQKQANSADASNFDAQMREMKQSFEVRIKELEELQSSAAKNAGADLSDDVAKLQKQLTDRDAVEKELRRQVDETRKELNKLSRGKNDVKYTLPESVTYKFEGSSKESKELAKQRDALQLKVTDLEARLKSMERSNSEYDAKIAELKAVASAPAATPAANVNVDLKIKEIEAAKDAQLRQLQKSYEQKLADAQAQSSSGVDSAAVDDLKKQLAEQAWRLQEQKASAEEQLIEAVAELQAMRDAEQKAARSSAGERRALYALLKNEAQKQAAAARVDYTAEVAASEVESSMFWESKLKELEATKDAQISQLTQNYERELQSLLGKLSDQKKDVKYTLPESVTYKFQGSPKEAQELAKQRDALQSKVERLEAQLKESAANAVNEIGADIDGQVAALKKQLEEAKTKAEQEMIAAIAEIQSSAQAEMTALRTLVKSESDEQLSQAKKSFTEEKEALIKAHTLEVQTLQNAINTSVSRDETLKMKQVEDAWKQKLEKAEADARTEAERSTAEYKATVARLEQQIKEVTSGYETTVAKLKKESQQSASDTERGLRKQLAAAQKEFEQLKSRQGSTTSNVRYSMPESVTYKFQGYTMEMKFLTKQRDALIDKIARLERQSNGGASTGSDQSELADLQAKLETIRAEHAEDLKIVQARIESEKATAERELAEKLQKSQQELDSLRQKYENELSKAGKPSSRSGFFSNMFGGSRDDELKSLDDKIRTQESLRKAAEGEAKDAREREATARAEVARLTSEVERTSSQASKEISSLREQLSKSVNEATASFAASSDESVKSYQRRIAELEAAVADNNAELVQAIARIQTDSEQELRSVVAQLQAEAQRELTATVERLNAERDAAVASAEKKFSDSVAQLEKASTATESETTSMVAQLLREVAEASQKLEIVQVDTIAWKDQATSYKTKVDSLQAERVELLSKLKNSRGVLEKSIADSIAKEKAQEQEMVRAVAQAMAEATVSFNAKLQESMKETQQTEQKLESLRGEFDIRVREAAKQANKQLAQREAKLEKELSKAQRDYASQAKKMESVDETLQALRAEYSAAEAKWARNERLMKADFEQRVKAGEVTLAEKIAFYESRVKTLTTELESAKKEAKVGQGSKSGSQVVVKRALFEFNKGKVAAEAAAREEAERALEAAKAEMDALRKQLVSAEQEAADAKAAAEEAAKEAARPRSFFEQLFGVRKQKTSTSSTATTSTGSTVEVTKVSSIQQELEATVATLNDLKKTNVKEIEAAKQAVRTEYEAKLKQLQSNVKRLETQLANTEKNAAKKLEAALEAAKAERTRMESSLRAELSAAKQLASNAKLAAQREYTTALRNAEEAAKKALREQADKAAAERETSERELRASSKKAIDKLKKKIASFEAMLDARDLEIEAKFNAQFDKLVVDFRREVEILQKALRDAEQRADKVVRGRESGKAREQLDTLRKKNEEEVERLRASYEKKLQDAIAAKEAALKDSRKDAMDMISKEKSKVESNLKSSISERERQLESDRANLERSFEKTMSERDAYKKEIASLKQSLDEAKKRLKEFVNLSDEELKVLEESKKVASELDSIKSKYAESMGVDVAELSEEESKGLTISSLRNIFVSKTSEKSRKTSLKKTKSTVDYFKQLLDMSEEDRAK